MQESPSSTRSTKAVGIATVTQERKKELLLEARRERIAWIQSSSFPFIESHGDGSNNGGGDSGDGGDPSQLLENKNEDKASTDADGDKDGMKVIRNVCQEVKLPSAIPIIDFLLEQNNQASHTTATSSTTSPSRSLTARELSNRLQFKINQTYKSNTHHEHHNLDKNQNNDSTLSSVEISMEQYMDKTDDQIFLFYYKDVLEKLCLPECADIVQGMRHFGRSFQDLSNQLLLKLEMQKQQQGQGGYDNVDKEKKSNTTSSEGERKDSISNKKELNANHHLNKLVSGLQKYISKLYESLASHIAWRDNVISSETKLMLETFIYSKCYRYIQPILSMVVVDNNDDDDNINEDEKNDSGRSRKEKEKSGKIIRICDDETMMQKRLEFLQFVEPKHLDMHAFFSSMSDTQHDDNDDENNDDDLPWQSKLDLSKPISHIKSLDLMYSPAQMLRCILEIYRCVNEALNEAICIGSGSGNSNTVSADDVLPSLILSVIHAKPSRIIQNLAFVEKFATEEQIRGEAGYAFTNLFSAVQFIKELDLQLEIEDAVKNNGDSHDENQEDRKREKGRPTLSMSVDLLTEKMKAYRLHWKSKEEAKSNISIEDKQEVDNHNDGCKEEHSTRESISQQIDEFKRIELSCREVKTARLRGENVNEWATSWFKEQIAVLNNHEANDQGEDRNKSEKLAAADVSAIEGFARSYSFLATDAKDVKVSDIPELLREYKMLVRTTEMLLMERNSLMQQNKQKVVATKRDQLERSLRTVMNKSSS